MKRKRILSMALAALLCAGSLSVVAFAATTQSDVTAELSVVLKSDKKKDGYNSDAVGKFGNFKVGYYVDEQTKFLKKVYGVIGGGGTEVKDPKSEGLASVKYEAARILLKLGKSGVSEDAENTQYSTKLKNEANKKEFVKKDGGVSVDTDGDLEGEIFESIGKIEKAFGKVTATSDGVLDLTKTGLSGEGAGDWSSVWEIALAKAFPGDSKNETYLESFKNATASEQLSKFNGVVDSVRKSLEKDIDDIDKEFKGLDYFATNAWNWAVAIAKIDRYEVLLKDVIDGLIEDAKTGKYVDEASDAGKARKAQLKVLAQTIAAKRLELQGENSVSGDGWENPTSAGKIGKVKYNYDSVNDDSTLSDPAGRGDLKRDKDEKKDKTEVGYRWADAAKVAGAVATAIEKLVVTDNNVVKKISEDGGTNSSNNGGDGEIVDPPVPPPIPEETWKVFGVKTKFAKTFWGWVQAYLLFGWIWGKA